MSVLFLYQCDSNQKPYRASQRLEGLTVIPLPPAGAALGGNDLKVWQRQTQKEDNGRDTDKAWANIIKNANESLEK